MSVTVNPETGRPVSVIDFNEPLPTPETVSPIDEERLRAFGSATVEATVHYGPQAEKVRAIIDNKYSSYIVAQMGSRGLLHS